MELAQAGQLAAAFLGGGMAKSLVDYLLNDRASRRTHTRPVDHERISILRQGIYDEYAKRTLADHDCPPESDGHRKMNHITMPALDALNDRTLLRRWTVFMERALIVPHAKPEFNITQRIGERNFRRFIRVLNRLNYLERRR